MYYLERTLEQLQGEQKELALRLMNDPDSFQEKRRYAEWYQAQAPADDKLLSEIREEIALFLPMADLNRKITLTSDMIASNILYGISPREFLQFQFEERTDAARNTYMTDAERFLLFRPFYDFSQYEYVRNKWLQYSRLKEFFGRDCVRCEDCDNESEMLSFFKFTEKHPVFIFKPSRMACGEGVRVVDSTHRDKRELYLELASSDYGGGIADEKILQDARMEAFHPDSVNSVRLVGLRDRKRHQSHFSQALFRIGRGREIVDNNDGAIRARIDIGTGVVYTLGSDSFGNMFIFHPDSGEKIVGFSVPRWSELLETADKVLERTESFARYIGFDLALSESGWKIIEVNPFPQIFLQQVTTQKGSRPELTRLAALCGDDDPDLSASAVL